jgi:hypothetical protein
MAISLWFTYWTNNGFKPYTISLLKSICLNVSGTIIFAQILIFSKLGVY